MDALRENILKIQTELIYSFLATGMRLPDNVLAGAFSATVFAAGKFSTGRGEQQELLTRLSELEEYFRTQSPLSEALRRIILDARPSQVKSFIRGYLVNYVYEW